MEARSTLTVLFEAPFWVGIYERFHAGRYEAAKITFGAEPKDGEVYEFVLKNWHTLSFSAPAAAQAHENRPVNPKRAQREIRAQLQPSGVGTKAQQALQLQREQMAIERKQRGRAQKQADKERQFQLRQEKKKAKHRGK